MKRIISIVAILLCFAITYAQETKPTKQETMDWIAGKIMKYKADNVFTIQYQNNIITYQDRNFKTPIVVKLNLENISSYDFDVNYPEGTNGHGIIGKVIKGNGIIKWYEPDGKLFIALDDFTLNGDGFDLSLESGLIDRMKKALDILIEYNTRVQGEKF